MLLKKFALQGAGGDGSDLGGGGTAVIESPAIDMDAAVATIADGLGFGKEPDDGNLERDGAGADGKPGAEPSAAPPPPAPTPAPPAGTPAPAATPAPTPAPAPGVAPRDINKAPESWKPEEAATWAQLPEQVRAAVHRREQDMFNGINFYRGHAQVGRAVQEALKDVMPDLQSRGVQPLQFVGNLVEVHKILTSQTYTPEQKTGFAMRLMENYGIKLGAAVDDGAPPVFEDPQIKGLTSRVEELQSKLNNYEKGQIEATRSKALAEIETFAKDPAHQYFDEVADDILLLIKGSGGQMGLKEAYDKAVMANPLTRAKEITRLNADAVAKAEKDNKDKAAAARQATSSNVKSETRDGRSAPVKGSMEDTMRQTLDEINARERS
jgi:hypothetical protein